MKTAVNIGVIALCAIGLSCRAPSPGDGSDRPAGSRGPEAYPLPYSLGAFDDRFDITREQFLAAAAEAEGIWEKAAGRQLFRPDRDAPFTLNLVFDERQERTIEANKLKAAIDSKGMSYDALVWHHARPIRLASVTVREFVESAP